MFDEKKRGENMLDACCPRRPMSSRRPEGSQADPSYSDANSLAMMCRARMIRMIRMPKC